MKMDAVRGCHSSATTTRPVPYSMGHCEPPKCTMTSRMTVEGEERQESSLLCLKKCDVLNITTSKVLMGSNNKIQAWC